MRLLVDMTETVLHGYNTGIQRVVRNVVARLPQLSQKLGVEMVPVIACGQELHAMLDPSAASAPRPLAAPVHRFAGRARLRCRKGLRQAIERLPGADALLRSWRRHRLYQPVRALRRQLVSVNAADCYLVLDSFWGRGTVVDAMAAARRRGARAAVVMYDLILVSHPQFCDPRVARDFQRDAPRVLSLANAVVAISATVAGQVRSYAARAVPGWDPQRCPVGFFHLGADLMPVADQAAAEWPGWPNGLWGDRPVFLMLGTLEPRKGHAFVLDAFEQRWQQGSTEGLLFMGVITGDMSATLARLAAATQAGRPFWHLSGAPDSAVATAIRRSRAGIVASCVEGFGLPIVEFMQMGLPVLASDIPVFREVGGDLPVYFSLDRADGLGDALDTFYRRENTLRQTLLDFRWPNWDAAAESLLRQVLELTA